MKKKLLIIISVVLIALFVSLYIFFPYIKPLKINYKWQTYTSSPESEKTFSFITNKLSRDDGAIYTNYLDKPSNGDETKGHDILSESEGLMMLYSLEVNDKNLFNKHFNIVDKYMVLDNGLISWRISKDNNQNKTSALIDDLRIAKALILAYDRFGEFKYRYAATELSKAILNKSTSEDFPVDFNDSYGVSDTLTLCYIDLETMNLLSKIHSKWEKLYVSSKKILDEGLVSNSIPLFRKSYNLKLKNYLANQQTELLYSLICWENKKDAGEDITPIINWIKDNLNSYGALYGEYSLDSGRPYNSIESTSIYAVASRLAYKCNDLELYNKLSHLLLKFQVTDTASSIYGSFGFAPREEVYSFDNLQGLLSLLKKSDTVKK